VFEISRGTRASAQLDRPARLRGGAKERNRKKKKKVKNVPENGENFKTTDPRDFLPRRTLEQKHTNSYVSNVTDDVICSGREDVKFLLFRAYVFRTVARFRDDNDTSAARQRRTALSGLYAFCAARDERERERRKKRRPNAKKNRGRSRRKSVV